MRDLALPSPTHIIGRRVRATFASPVNLGDGILLSRVDGVLTYAVPATFAQSVFSLCDVSLAVDHEGRDVTFVAGLFGAFITADLRNLAAMEIVLPLPDSASGAP